MILDAIVSQVLSKLDQPSSSGFYSPSEATAAVNEGQLLFALMTLCIETTSDFNLVPGQTFYHMLETFPHWIVPLRVTLSTGQHIRPARLEDLEAIDSGWVSGPGIVKRYVSMGFDLLGVFGQPAQSSFIIVTFAAAPQLLFLGTDVPEIPVQFHPVLVDYAIYRLRFREGADQFQKALPYFARFLEQAQKHAAFVRARNLATRYDSVPFEMSLADMSRLLKVRKDVMPRRGDE